MGRLNLRAMRVRGLLIKFPMIPPQVNGATKAVGYQDGDSVWLRFPMIPPQVNGATLHKTQSIPPR